MTGWIIGIAVVLLLVVALVILARRLSKKEKELDDQKIETLKEEKQNEQIIQVMEQDVKIEEETNETIQCIDEADDDELIAMGNSMFNSSESDS